MAVRSKRKTRITLTELNIRLVLAGYNAFKGLPTKRLIEVDINEISGNIINIGRHTGFCCSDNKGFSAFGKTCDYFSTLGYENNFIVK